MKPADVRDDEIAVELAAELTQEKLADIERRLVAAQQQRLSERNTPKFQNQPS